jgi:hypothetical protein
MNDPDDTDGRDLYRERANSLAHAQVSMSKRTARMALAPGCCSAISPCSHQREHPNTLCEVCQRSLP